MAPIQWPAKLEQKQVRLICLPLAAALASLLYFYPFQDSFRISAGVVVLGVTLALEREIPPLPLTLLAGAEAILLRSLVGLLAGGDASVWTANAYAGGFYLAYGLLATVCRVSRWADQPLAAGAALLCMDLVANLAEVLLRREFEVASVWAITVTAVIRGSLAAAVLEGLRLQKLYILRREHQQRYDSLNVLIADLNAELFYLKKSEGDINEVMSKSFRLYEAHQDSPEISGPALEISRSIHEIGKDYRRILQGMRSLLNDTESHEEMLLSDMARIIRENTTRTLAQSGKLVRFRFDLPFDMPIQQFYSLFAILNNLIVNAADACGSGAEPGEIRVTARQDAGQLIFEVADNGCGIEPDLLDYLFEPGFTTKFHPETGVPSTGIGLSHVRNLVDAVGGTIQVQSRLGEGTTFQITIPILGESKSHL